MHPFFNLNRFPAELIQSPGYGADHVEGCDIAADNTNMKDDISIPEGHVVEQLHTMQMSLPKNLGVLVEKAMNNLKKSDKAKM